MSPFQGRGAFFKFFQMNYRRSPERVALVLKFLSIIRAISLPTSDSNYVQFHVGIFYGPKQGGSSTKQTMVLDFSQCKLSADGTKLTLCFIPPKSSAGPVLYLYGQNGLQSAVQLMCVNRAAEERQKELLHYPLLFPLPPPAMRERMGVSDHYPVTHTFSSPDRLCSAKVTILGRRGVEKLGVVLGGDPDMFKGGGFFMTDDHAGGRAGIFDGLTGMQSMGPTQAGHRANRTGDMEEIFFTLPIDALFAHSFPQDPVLLKAAADAAAAAAAADAAGDPGAGAAAAAGAGGFMGGLMAPGAPPPFLPAGFLPAHMGIARPAAPAPAPHRFGIGQPPMPVPAAAAAAAGAGVNPAAAGAFPGLAQALRPALQQLPQPPPPPQQQQRAAAAAAMEAAGGGVGDGGDGLASLAAGLAVSAANGGGGSMGGGDDGASPAPPSPEARWRRHVLHFITHDNGAADAVTQCLPRALSKAESRAMRQALAAAAKAGGKAAAMAVVADTVSQHMAAVVAAVRTRFGRDYVVTAQMQSILDGTYATPDTAEQEAAEQAAAAAGGGEPSRSAPQQGGRNNNNAGSNAEGGGSSSESVPPLVLQMVRDPSKMAAMMPVLRAQLGDEHPLIAQLLALARTHEQQAQEEGAVETKGQQ